MAEPVRFYTLTILKDKGDPEPGPQFLSVYTLADHLRVLLACKGIAGVQVTVTSESAEPATNKE